MNKVFLNERKPFADWLELFNFSNFSRISEFLLDFLLFKSYENLNNFADAQKKSINV